MSFKCYKIQEPKLQYFLFYEDILIGSYKKEPTKYLLIKDIHKMYWNILNQQKEDIANSSIENHKEILNKYKKQIDNYLKDYDSFFLKEKRILEINSKKDINV